MLLNKKGFVLKKKNYLNYIKYATMQDNTKNMIRVI
jgi:hypothetical protein